MASFLHDAARSIADHYGGDLSDLNIVFASRRAERFFTIELKRIGVKTKPNFTTIDELMLRFSVLDKANNLTTLAEMYKIYQKVHPEESFDTFYSFGKLILGDFDSVDKYMVDAAKLYSIVSQTRDVENEFRDELHDEALKFWSSFQARRAQMHKEQAFLQIWQSLFSIYTELNAALSATGYGYSGAIYRDAAQRIHSTPIDQLPKYIFIGLNAISRSEHIVLTQLAKNDKADFLWDFDTRWLEEPNNEAAYFVKENIKHFPQAHYLHITACDELPTLNVVAAPSEIMQCKVTAIALDSISGKLGIEKLDERTAIVLTDENLLIPLLHSLPDCASTINISIGYPISSTSAYQFFERVIALQTSADSSRGFYHQSVLNILQHPFIGNADFVNELIGSQELFFSSQRLVEAGEYAKAIFAKIGRSNTELQNYLLQVIDCLTADFDTIEPTEKYALSIIRTKILELQTTSANCGIDLSRNIYITLLSESIRAERLPYQGVSGSGVQIMGILETRALDFDNIILLSMSDDNFPSAKNPSSYIPQNLRLAYGLPGIKEHSAIWSYYFYRLLQRAKRVVMIYCNANDEKSSGERSRYIYQLQYNSPYTLIETQVDFAVNSRGANRQITIDKSHEAISSILERSISPSALNRYVNCPLAFYFNDVAGIKESKELDESVSNLDIGNTLHLTMQELYHPIVGRENAQQIVAQITTGNIKACVHKIMLKTCGAKADTLAPSVAMAEVAVCRMVENIVCYDSQRSVPFTIMALEEQMSIEIEGIALRGTADRIDRLDSGRIRVIDYKSGGDEVCFSSVEDITQGVQKEHRSAILQILVYSLMAAKRYKTTIYPALYVARKIGSKHLTDPTIVMSGRELNPIDEQTMQQTEKAIGEILAQMTDPAIEWRQSANKPDSCKYCPYRTICQN